MDGLRRFLTRATLLLITVSFGSDASAGPLLIGPAAYGSAIDSPFNGAAFSYWYLETFEDGLTTPGVSASGGFVIGADPYVDSADADDGVMDGLGGSDSHSWYSNGLTTLTFTFDPVTLGTLPTHVGIVWTDIGYNAPTPYFGPVSFEAFGANGTSLGVLASALFGDGMDTGQTDEDRFFGVVDAAGISAIRLVTNNGDWEVDHVQYGAAMSVPEPSSLLLLGVGVAGLIRSRARGRARS